MVIDLSHVIQNGMPPFPGDAETILIQSKNIQQDYYTNHHLTVNMHAGTHIDGPMHLMNVNTYLNDYPLEKYIGEGILIDVSGKSIIDYDEQYEELLLKDKIIVLYTGHSKYFGQPGYFTDHPVLTEEFATFLVRKHVKMVCLDMPSPDKYPFAVHKTLFESNILIAENVTNVEQLLNKGSFEIIALPLNIRADSSIARIIARIM